MQTKAYAYLRVSSKGQVKGDGFPRQLAAIQAYAKAHGIKLTRIYREEGIKGATELEHRPALTELLVRNGNGTGLVLIEKLDRLARDLMVQETIIRDLQRHGLRLISVAEPDLLKDDPTRKLMRQMMGAIAEYEKAMIVAKLRAARERKKAKTGRCEGQKPFGWYPGEQPTISRMMQLRQGGTGYDSIATKLTAEGITTRKGTPWHAAGVRRVILRESA